MREIGDKGERLTQKLRRADTGWLVLFDDARARLDRLGWDARVVLAVRKRGTGNPIECRHGTTIGGRK